MKRFDWAIRITLVAGGACLLAGCELLLGPESDRRKEAGEVKEATGDLPGAIAIYETAFDGTPKAAEIHYKLALIYDEKVNNPISAIHHFQRYLDLAPDGAHRKDAANFINDARLKLSASFGHGATVPQQEAVRLKNDNMVLRMQVLELRAELEAASRARALALKNAGVKGMERRGEQVQKPLVPGVRTYTVVQGDTLASIAQKFYKNKARWRDIQDANFSPMEGTARLRIGMELMIP